MLNEFLDGLSKEELINLTIAYQNYLFVDHEDEFNYMDRAPVCLMEFYDHEYQELIEKEKITMYCENQSNEFTKILNERFGIDITEKQALLVINYLEGSGFAIGIGENKIYQLDTEVDIDSDVDYVNPEEKSMADIVHQILGWQDDFSQHHGEVNMDAFTLEDMQDEESFYMQVVDGSYMIKDNIPIFLFEHEDVAQKARIGVDKFGDQFSSVRITQSDFGSVTSPVFTRQRLAGC